MKGMTVEMAINEFYRRHNIPEEGGKYEKWASVKFGFIAIPIPNLKGRSENLYLHDVSHVITGSGTTWKEESGIAAWEVGSGGWGKLWLPWFFVLSSMGVGSLLYPRNTRNAFVQGMNMHNALNCNLPKNTLLSMDIGQAKQKLKRKIPLKKNPEIWMFISILVLLAPLAALIFLILSII